MIRAILGIIALGLLTVAVILQSIQFALAGMFLIALVMG